MPFSDFCLVSDPISTVNATADVAGEMETIPETMIVWQVYQVCWVINNILSESDQCLPMYHVFYNNSIFPLTPGIIDKSQIYFLIRNIGHMDP